MTISITTKDQDTFSVTVTGSTTTTHTVTISDQIHSKLTGGEISKEILLERLNDLSQSVAKKIDEIEEMEALLKDKDKIIEIMNMKIRDKQKRPVFQLPKGDLLDQMLSHYINQANCPVPIRKIGNGFYLFGTKKIYAKILNGKLVIRVGGGFMIIEEFIATYADSEMNKISKMSDEQLIALSADTTAMAHYMDPNARLSMYRGNAV